MDVMILGKIPQPGISLLKAWPDVEVHLIDPNDSANIDACIERASGIIIRTSLLGADLIRKAKNLRVVSRFGVGFDNIDVNELTRSSIPLAVVGENNALSVAEHTLYLILAASKMGIAYDRAVRSGNWSFRESLMASDLSGHRVLIVGLGRIGSAVGRLCEAFGMSVSYYDPRPELQGAQPGWERADDLRSGLAAADVVSVHVPLNDSTRNLIAAPEFQSMKKNAVIVSTSRGGVVNEVDLAAALTARQIKAAGLDVFETEPVRTDNPLLGLDNAILSPHVAALSLECAERMSIAAAKNCIDGIRGTLNPAFVVNPQVLNAEPVRSASEHAVLF